MLGFDALASLLVVPVHLGAEGGVLFTSGQFHHRRAHSQLRLEQAQIFHVLGGIGQRRVFPQHQWAITGFLCRRGCLLPGGSLASTWVGGVGAAGYQGACGQ